MTIETVISIAFIVAVISFYIGLEMGKNAGMSMCREQEINDADLEEQGVPKGYNSKFEFVNRIIDIVSSIEDIPADKRRTIKRKLYKDL